MFFHPIVDPAIGKVYLTHIIIIPNIHASHRQTSSTSSSLSFCRHWGVVYIRQVISSLTLSLSLLGTSYFKNKTQQDELMTRSCGILLNVKLEAGGTEVSPGTCWYKRGVASQIQSRKMAGRFN